MIEFILPKSIKTIVTKKYNDMYNQLRKAQGKAYPRTQLIKNIRAFQDYILTHDMPGVVGFDHDLQAHKSDNEPNGREVATWFKAHCTEKGVEMPLCWVHSGNRYGAPEIRKILGLADLKE